MMVAELGVKGDICTCPQKLNNFSRISYLKPVTKAAEAIIVATLSAVAIIASRMMNDENPPLRRSRYRRAMKKGRFTMVSKIKLQN
jgi:hypothetical protein